MQAVETNEHGQAGTFAVPEGGSRSPATARRRPFNLKGFTSLLLAMSFLVMAFTGTVLYFAPRGRVANWTGWTMLGLGRESWIAMHIANSLLFLVVAGLHLGLNWGMFWGYLRKKSAAGIHLRKELALAAIVASLMVAGTIYDLPPFRTLMTWNRRIKDYWEVRAARAPVAHSEELTLPEFARQIDLSLESVIAALTKEGFEVKDTSSTISQIAAEKGVPPSEVLAAVEKHYPLAGGMAQRGPGAGRGQHGPGMGRGMGQGRGMGMGWDWEEGTSEGQGGKTK
jgi:hypothetical protein